MDSNHPVYNNKPSNLLSQIFFSFKVAFTGLFYVLLTQRNMRFHFSIAVWVMCFAIVFNLSGFEKAYLFIVITFVISMEVVNSCVEALTNLLSPEYNKYAKIAKDTGAAAVLAVSIGSVMSAGYLLIPPFFRYIPNAQWMAEHHRQMIAIAVLVSSVLAFWLIRALRFIPGLFLFACAAASSSSITLLGIYGHDFISFCALQFFSTLLFNSMARSRNSMATSVAGHAAGVAVYFSIGWII